ncbi:hypothetical protein ASD64_09090 [Mesorhizobium sp. Root157]|uniref:hypothetical protein n=1 Tax=Mesorhizobium sp. Root157 TaxID=1736477 RepID=UPI0006F2DEC5|nr:hypothetical protein [Mesorhizobium sp. Root157]KQZ81899.1 hypothetical protein ASD64_09090 [Mesorhizobium sp. Root157]
MRAATFDRVLADRGLAAVRQMSAQGLPILPPPPFASAQGPQDPDRVGAAEVVGASAAFHHFTESGPAQPDTTAPVCPPSPSAGAVTLSDHAMILLRAISAYEQIDDATALTMALATHAAKIGAGPLARACLDQIERHGGSREYSGERVDGGAGGVDAGSARLLPKADTRSGGP